MLLSLKKVLTLSILNAINCFDEILRDKNTKTFYP